MRRFLIVLGLLAASWALASPAMAVSGAGYTTVNTAVDGPNHCKNGNPGVNCNIYDSKEAVWLNGGPAANGLGPDGQYFFAVLEPGGQPNPNDGGAKNLSDDYDTYTNRTFTVTGGEVSAYGGTHTFDSGSGGGAHPNGQPPFIRLFPYADTSNPGGVYIMAICSLGAGYPVVPKSCKYDAFKVQKAGQGKVQAVLSGRKYFDANTSGSLDSGDSGLGGWVVHIVGSDGTDKTVTTDASGDWSYTTPAHNPTSGTTTYTISEVQQAGWVQTGNTVNQSLAMGGATSSLSSFVYTVTVPNDAVSDVEQLFFGNFRNQPPACPPPTWGIDALGRGFVEVTVQDTDGGIAAINVLSAYNASVDVPAFAVGTTTPLTVRGTRVDPSFDFSMTLEIVDVFGASTVCDPVLATLVRSTGSADVQRFSNLMESESKVTIANGNLGLSVVELAVNGIVYRVTGLADGETRSIDVSAAMRPGTSNTIVATSHGSSGATAFILISN